MPNVGHLFWTLLALIFLGVSWVWEKLRPPIQWVIDLIPLEGLKRAVAAFMQSLPPYPTLFVFLVPLVALEPGKIVALWLIAKGQWLLGVFTYIVTDVLRLGLVSFLFKTSQPKLLSIAWFRRLYELFVQAHQWAHDQVKPMKAAAYEALHRAGLHDHSGEFWHKIVALWRHARNGGFSEV